MYEPVISPDRREQMQQAKDCRCTRSEWKPDPKRLHGSWCEQGRQDEAKAVDAPWKR